MDGIEAILAEGFAAPAKMPCLLLATACIYTSDEVAAEGLRRYPRACGYHGSGEASAKPT